MGQFYIPLIREENYEATWGRLGDDIPNTFAEWRYKRFKEIAEYQGGGDTTVDVHIDLTEFLGVCAKTGTSPSREALYGLAYRIGSAKEQ